MELPELINAYKSFLGKNLSKVTIKNYLSDINHFISWFANTYSTPFQPDLLTKTVISAYSAFLESPSEAGNVQYSFKSSRRHISSLRSFASFLKNEDYLAVNPFELQLEPVVADLWRMKEFKNFLFENSSSDLTVKYYINDIQSFSRWYEESIGQVSGNTAPTLTIDIITEYTRRLQDSLLLSPKTVNRKLSSIRRYAQFLAIEERLKGIPLTPRLPVKPSESVSLTELTISESESNYSKIPPVRLVQKLTNPYFKLEDKAATLLSSKIVKTRIRKALHADQKPQAQPIDKLVQGLSGKNLKKEFYAPYSVSTSEFPVHKKVIFHMRHTRPQWYKKYHSYPFVHYIHFGVLVVASVGAAIFLYQNTIGNAQANDYAQRQTTFQKTFVFKGKLLDKENKPITEATDLRLGLYTNPTASGSALAWQEVQSSIKPDEDGNITIVIGNKTLLPEHLFQTNAPVFLGITVGTENELTPRQPIGVPYASSAENVQGLLPITSTDKQTNVLLALDASGVLSIGGEANPVFQATGGQFTLSGNTVLLTTNAGTDGYVIINPSGNGRIDLQKPLTNSQGIVMIEGGFGITASTSASPAFSISQDNGGPLIVASTAGSTRFMVDSQGTVTKGIWAGSPISPEFGGFGANITPSSPGELIYSKSPTEYGHLRAGTAGQCLTANGFAAPLWSACGFLSQLNGTLTLTNNSMDIILGSTSTGSAKFALTGMSTNNPTFKVGQILSLSSNILEADNQDLRLGGSNTKNVLLASAGGNVGINSSTPTRTLDVTGNWGGNVDFYSDGANTQTITRTTKALIYDLEKDTGGTDTSTITTYNIVGLPEVDGTFAYVYTKVSKSNTTSSQTQTINIQINGTQLGSVATIPGTSSSTVIEHYTLVRSNGTWHLLGNTGNSDAADLAEWTPFEGAQPQAGAIVSVGNHGKLVQSTTAYDAKVAGIVSTNPRIVIGLQTNDTTPLALSGRVPVIVTSVNGDIQQGDSLASSPILGSGMKLTRGGATVGKALSTFTPSSQLCKEASSLESISWPNDTGKNEANPCFKVPVASFDPLTQTQLQRYGLTAVDYLYIGKVMALASLSWSNSEDLIASIDAATIEHSTPALESLDGNLAAIVNTLSTSSDVVKVGGKAIDKVEALSALAAGKIKAGTIIATNVFSENLYATAATISNLTVSDKLTAAQLVSPVITTDSLIAGSISPKKGKSLTVALPKESALVVKNEAQEEVARIDASGNASFAGTLSSESLDTNDATVSGTLHARNLIADNIEGLDSRVSSIAAQIASSQPAVNAPLPNLSAALTSSVSAQFGTFYDGLLSLGASTFGNLSVMDQLSVGTTLTFTPNAINTLGTDLAIQPLRQGAVSFLAGAIRIETDGRLIVNEDALFNKNLAVKGKVLTNVISPLSNSDISVTLPAGEDNDANFNVKNASGSAVVAVTQKGDIVSSGSATFAKLNLSLVGQAEAADPYTATASSSAGTAILKANTNELTIINPLVTENSLIYITPAQNTNNTVLYLMRQNPGTPTLYSGRASFTVGVSKSVPTDTLFNWLIVN